MYVRINDQHENLEGCNTIRDLIEREGHNIAEVYVELNGEKQYDFNRIIESGDVFDIRTQL